MQSIIPHAFGRHNNCNASWCGYQKDPDNYRHKDLPHGKNLHGPQLRTALENLFSEYSTDIVIK